MVWLIFTDFSAGIGQLPTGIKAGAFAINSRWKRNDVGNLNEWGSGSADFRWLKGFKSTLKMF